MGDWPGTVRRHAPRVYALAAALTGDERDAADLTEATFRALAWSAAAPRDVGQWLHATTIELFQRPARPRRVDRPPDQDGRRGQRALDVLAPDVRVAIVLGDLAGLRHAETAALLGLGVTALRERLYRGRMDVHAALTATCPPPRRPARDRGPRPGPSAC